jgi:hypothetical protein
MPEHGGGPPRVGNVRTLGAHSATPSGATPRPFCATTTKPRNKTLRCVSSFNAADASTSVTMCFSASLGWFGSRQQPDQRQMGRSYANDPGAYVGCLAASSVWTTVGVIANCGWNCYAALTVQAEAAPHERDYPRRKDRF